MSLFAIGDLHLSLGAEKPMDVFGGRWQDYTEKIKKGFAAVVGPEDVTVICGDVSWGMDFDSAREDFLYIDALPGKKLILKGNHDYWWSTAAKARNFFAENGIGSIGAAARDARHGDRSAQGAAAAVAAVSSQAGGSSAAPSHKRRRA